ncbi:Hsp70 family protein [Geodermatophilus sp. URMC 62]|uniref:Hsp70 family protein n=1 Tax=Geodermatophilus sp. URMC 62 TaxID=3423414 RepID=UPI00406CC8B8
MTYSLGVDLGTTSVAAAVGRDRGVDVFPLGEGSLVVPAVVLVRDDGRLVTGDAAARRAASSPDRVAREVRRSLGNPDPLVLGGRPHTPTVLLAALLRDVLERVREVEGDDPGEVVLTHPATWGPFRRELFEEVPASAGLATARFVPEPEAAAAHHATTHRLAEGETIAVYDLGGGTFDATVLRRSRTGFDVLGTPDGIERLGGADFDDAVLTHVDNVSGGALSELDTGDPRTVVALTRLRQDCVLAKETLSTEPETTIPVFLPTRHVEVPLTRAEFENMIRAPVESTIGTLDRALRTARVEAGELTAVLLVGGSSRIPLVARMVSEELGRPTVVSAHPVHAVALGAALLGRSRSGRDTTAGRAASAARAPRQVPSSVPAPRAAAGPAVGTSGPEAGTRPSPVASVVAPPAPAASGPPRRPGTPPPGSPSPGRPGSRPRRRPLLAGIAAVLVVALAGLGIYLVLRPAPRDVEEGAGSPASSAASSSEASPSPQVATSVPVPSVAGTIPVGETPGFVAAAPDGRQLYVANRAAGVVTVVDTAAGQVTATIPVTAGPSQFLTFSPDGREVYVSVWDDARTVAAVSVLDTTTNTVVDTIGVRTRPFLAAVTADGEELYVPNHDSGTISVIDTRTRDVVHDFRVPANPHWIDFTPDGTRAYVADHESDLVSVVDPATDTVVAEVPVEHSPHSVAVNPVRPLVAAVNFDSASVSVIDTDSNTVVGRVAVGTHPQFVTWAPDGRFAYVVNNGDDSVSVISADGLTVTATIPTGPSPTSLAVLPDGTTGYVSDLDGRTLTVLDLAA